MSMLTNPAAEAFTLADSGAMHESGHRGGTFRGISPAGRVVARWHDDVHPGAFSQCSEQPCDAVRRVDIGGGDD